MGTTEVNTQAGQVAEILSDAVLAYLKARGSLGVSGGGTGGEREGPRNAPNLRTSGDSGRLTSSGQEAFIDGNPSPEGDLPE